MGIRDIYYNISILTRNICLAGTNDDNPTKRSFVSHLWPMYNCEYRQWRYSDSGSIMEIWWLWKGSASPFFHPIACKENEAIGRGVDVFPGLKHQPTETCPSLPAAERPISSNPLRCRDQSHPPFILNSPEPSMVPWMWEIPPKNTPWVDATDRKEGGRSREQLVATRVFGIQFW